MRYSRETRTRKYVKGYGFLSFARNLPDKHRNNLIETTSKTGCGAAKAASEKVLNKAAEAAGELLENKIADKIVKIKPTAEAKQSHIKEM